MTAQCEGMGEVGSARYEPALLPPCPSIRVLSYSNCQRSTHSSRRAWQCKFKCNVFSMLFCFLMINAGSNPIHLETVEKQYNCYTNFTSHRLCCLLCTNVELQIQLVTTDYRSVSLLKMVNLYTFFNEEILTP